ncbi:phytanoyl-CoA dioxygenase family protein [Streptacidiphilus sp. N1-3]|uniref:Phytanoyl-CoA dioxygenase family protein n=1 Tax=Streptacidiphilus alkalitolerans TaxID=3342712 RepID=A0ABV6XAR9_9ACTN
MPTPSTQLPCGLLGPSGVSPLFRWADAEDAHTVGLRVAAALEPQASRILTNVHLRASWAVRAVRSACLLREVEKALGPNVAVENTFLVVKFPGVFSVPWHVDGKDVDFELDPDHSVSAFLALSRMDEKNGALQVLPGSHLEGYEGDLEGPSLASERDAELLEMDPGEAVLFDSRILHSSDRNRSHAPRIGLNIRYVTPQGCVNRSIQAAPLDIVGGQDWPASGRDQLRYNLFRPPQQRTRSPEPPAPNPPAAPAETCGT